MSCLECGAENRVGAKFCKDCGAKLAVTALSEDTQPISSPPGGAESRDATRAPDAPSVSTSPGSADTTEVNARFATAVPLKELASQPAAHEPETTPFATLTRRLATTERRLLGVLALAVIAIIVGIIAATSGGNTSNSTSAPVANTDNQTSATTVPPTTPPTTTPPPPATNTPTVTVPANVLALANQYADAFSNHQWASVRALNPSLASQPDSYFDQNTPAPLTDTFIPLGYADAGAGNIDLHGSLIAQAPSGTDLYCSDWTINPSQNTVMANNTPSGGTFPAGTTAQDLASAARQACPSA
jgi:hypothetical protein